MTIRVRKAVFPVAGLGTRFLPATKAVAKEMLRSWTSLSSSTRWRRRWRRGSSTLVFVTGHGKKAIEDHFDRAAELESVLESKGKIELLARVREILPSHVTCLYIRQPAPLGLGHAVLCARPAVGDEPFAILLPDDLIDCDGPGCTEQMVRHFRSAGHGLVAVQSVPREETDRYGIVGLASPNARGGPIREIVEKPVPDRAPSTLGVVGRYVMPAGIFDALEDTAAGSGGEIQLTDGIAAPPPAGDDRGVCVRGNAIRLRLEGGVPGRQHRACAQATRALRDNR